MYIRQLLPYIRSDILQNRFKEISISKTQRDDPLKTNLLELSTVLDTLKRPHFSLSTVLDGFSRLERSCQLY
jgi:hypothetical protein